MLLLRSLEPASVQAIILDPPYGVTRPGGPLGFNPRLLLQEAYDALADGGAIYFFTRWDVQQRILAVAPPELDARNAIVWVKEGYIAGELLTNFAEQYETILFFTKGRHRRRGRRWTNVWTFPRVPAKKLKMPTEKPVDLLARIVEACTVPGDTIVDPYCGTGTTGAAAGRFKGVRVILGDLDPKMVKLTCERLMLPAPEGLDEMYLGDELTIDPVYQMQAPDPSSWGIHPEDLVRFFRRDTPEVGPPAEEGTIDVLAAMEEAVRLESE